MNFEYGCMLEKLEELNGIDVFFIYLSSLMRAAKIVEDFDEFRRNQRDLIEEIFRTARCVTEDQRFRTSCEGSAVTNLILEMSGELIQ